MKGYQPSGPPGDKQPESDSNDGAYWVGSELVPGLPTPVPDEQRDNYVREFKPAFPIFPGIPPSPIGSPIDVKHVIGIED